MRWDRSFRTRVVVMVALITTLAIGVTVWVTVAATSQTITASAKAGQQDVDLIADELRTYAVQHGTWSDVSPFVDRLRARTGQRIELVTEQGRVVVDTDGGHGRAARAPSSTAPVAVVPRPAFTLSQVDPSEQRNTTLDAITSYRRDTALAACLTEHGVTVTGQSDHQGVPHLAASDADLSSAGCTRRPVDDATQRADFKAVLSCDTTVVIEVDPPQPSPTATGPTVGTNIATLPDGTTVDACLQAVFQTRTADVGAETLLLYTGVSGTSVVHRDTRRILYSTIPVLLLALAVAVLLARRALRPVDAVILAARQFSSGHRAARVRVHGRDEMAALATSFNDMAASVQRGESQQRDMVADVAHELRTPLANIRGYLEGLMDGVLPATPEVFASLHEEALLQQRVIDDLQDLALADRRGLITRRVPTDLAELVRTVQAAHAAHAQAVGVTLLVDAMAPVPADVDPDRLRQAVGNLVTNALRATAAGGTVTLRATREGDGAVIEVEDTGHGIAAADLPSVFDRFWRADPSRTRSTGGSGLGLAITREIVRGHDGTIDVRSAEGVGTSFVIRL